ncbi:hypothetical protein ACLOJK_018680 [Asimina triloba]
MSTLNRILVGGDIIPVVSYRNALDSVHGSLYTTGAPKYGAPSLPFEAPNDSSYGCRPVVTSMLGRSEDPSHPKCRQQADDAARRSAAKHGEKRRGSVHCISPVVGHVSSPPSPINTHRESDGRISKARFLWLQATGQI